ncbi:MAG: hypothetical protein OEY85_13050, partial [Rhodospirillales bacterium]|nr:hypothetical protein [Rhodospirillales bacterium]
MTPRTRIIIVICLFLATLAGVLFVPPIPQPASYHGFADRRSFLGIPNFADVMSNFGFLIVGVLGLARVFAP